MIHPRIPKNTCCPESTASNKGRNVKKRIIALFLSLIMCAAFSGCEWPSTKTASASDTMTSAEAQAAFEAPRPGEYDSADTCIVTTVSKVNGTISFYNYELQKYYTLVYDSITSYADKYGSAISLDQVKEGYLVDITFLKSKKLLVSLRESKASLVIEDTSGFSVDSGAKVLKYRSESYKLTEGTILMGGESKETVRDIKPEDVLTIVGENNEVYAITVKKGHGTLSLRGDDALVGGTLTVGKDFSIHIIKGMEITLPEGEQTISFVKGNTEVTRKVTISRNEKSVLDVSDIEVEVVKTGKVLFTVTPDNAEVYVDGALIDHSRLHEYTYGLHKVVVSAKGYETLSRYFKVAEPQATLPVTLEQKESAKEEKEEDKTDGFFIVISSPTGVEVSFDGNYMGISPISIKKVSGSHVISLHKNGYISRSYNVNIENTAENVYYSFENMAPEKEEKKETTKTVSGNNSVSGNVSGN